MDPKTGALFACENLQQASGVLHLTRRLFLPTFSRPYLSHLVRGGILTGRTEVKL